MTKREKPNLAGLIEDPQHPDFRHQLTDHDGVVWCAMFNDGVTEPTADDVIWERLAISPDRLRELQAGAQ